MSRFVLGLIGLVLVVGLLSPFTAVEAGGGGPTPTPTATSTTPGPTVTLVAGITIFPATTCVGPHDWFTTNHVDLVITRSGSVTLPAGEGIWAKVTNTATGATAHFQYTSSSVNDRSELHDAVNSIRWEGSVKLVPGGTYKITLVRAPYSETSVPTGVAIAEKTFTVDCAFSTQVPSTPTVQPTSVPFPPSPPEVVGLHSGWNLIAFPEAGAYGQVSSLTANMVKQGVDVRQVVRWENGRWESYLPLFAVNDFQLETRRGYFVRVARDAIWTPSSQNATLVAVKRN